MHYSFSELLTPRKRRNTEVSHFGNLENKQKMRGVHRLHHMHENPRKYVGFPFCPPNCPPKNESIVSNPSCKSVDGLFDFSCMGVV